MTGLDLPDVPVPSAFAVSSVTLDQPLIVAGRVDRAGRLTSADPRLLALQIRAGGEAGGPLVVPALTSLARLARTLGVLVSRGVIAAEGDRDIDLWVRAQPDNDGVALTISGWDERPAPIRDERAEADRDKDFAVLESDGAWACDAELRVTEFDARLAELSGGAAGDLITRLFRLSEDEHGDLPLLNGFAARKPFAGQAAELRNTPGVRVVLHGFPAAGPQGEHLGFEGGYRLAERPHSAPRRPAMPTADDGFSARLDHALREPLGRIIASADDIASRQDGPLRQDYADYASDISSAGRHLLGLVDDLADLQAAERLDFRIDAETLDLADLSRRASGLLAVRAADRGVRIDPPPSDEVLEAKGDFRRILQILVNLIGNAVRYSPEGAAVWVRTEEEGDLAAIIVADQGKGIAPDDHSRIFEKFERVDPSEANGSGLGLYISRQLARAMGGDITVDSAPGMGARFILTLPRS